MAGAAGCVPSPLPTSGRAGRVTDIPGAAGSLVLRLMDRRGHKRGLVRAKKHGTKSGPGAPLRRGFSWKWQVRLSVIMYMAVPTVTWEVSMNFLQNRRVLWVGAAIIVLIVLLVSYGWLYGWPGGETPPAQ